MISGGIRALRQVAKSLWCVAETVEKQYAVRRIASELNRFGAGYQRQLNSDRALSSSSQRLCVARRFRRKPVVSGEPA